MPLCLPNKAASSTAPYSPELALAAVCNGIRVIVQVMFIVGVFMLVNHARTAVKTLSALRSRDAPEAGMCVRPTI
jgi:hypothetical protein